MTEKSRPAPPGPSSGAMAWWADRSHRYVLPVAGAVAVALGLSLALGARFPAGAYLPLVLVLLGIGVLASALAHLEVRKAPPAEAAVASERFIADTLVICPSCSARSFEAGSTSTPPSGGWRVPDPSQTVPAPGSAVASATNPSGLLWGTSWLSESRRLPVELVGPVPVTVYVPPRPGASPLPAKLEPARSGVPETGDLPGGSGGLTPRGNAETPGRTWTISDLPGSGPRVSANTRNREGVGSSAFEYPVGDLVLREALNPTPPHLRTGPSLAEAPSRLPLPHSWEPVPPTQCADCHDPVPDPASWRRCSDCRHVLCADCMVSALLTRERAWCSHCAEVRSLTVR